MAGLAQPLFQQLLHPSLAEFWNKANDDQFYNLKNEVFIEVRIIQAIQQLLDLFQYLRSFGRRKESRCHLGREQAQQCGGAAALDCFRFFKRRSLAWGAKRIVWKDGCADSAEKDGNEGGVEDTGAHGV